MISRVKEAILQGGAYITDFHMFSNIAICINFEVSVGNIEKLYSSLRQQAFLNQESHDLLAACCVQLAELGERAKATDVVGTLEITFIHDEPDLRIEVPPIP
ncbi:MAG: hypothetical protein ABR577_02720 [Pyrinomonadaceae bacterium]